VSLPDNAAVTHGAGSASYPQDAVWGLPMWQDRKPSAVNRAPLDNRAPLEGDGYDPDQVEPCGHHGHKTASDESANHPFDSDSNCQQQHSLPYQFAPQLPSSSFHPNASRAYAGGELSAIAHPSRDDPSVRSSGGGFHPQCQPNDDDESDEGQAEGAQRTNFPFYEE